ncbi:hypothetical protein C7H79_07760 [Nitrosomonas supralitoralis]|uniref:Plastocyanin-like domain-containing protein n=2 Tax=Nitrosomonas supralitoralis TaxID=2116706 RepID=A0A2P7NVR2_9PROT|nr:hypothetical protein C7H79_07760 [Nitrosomonas supralitoralis]
MIPLPAISAAELENAKHRTFVYGRGAATDMEPVIITQARMKNSPAPNRPGNNFTYDINGQSANLTEFEQLPVHAPKPWGIETDGGDSLGMNPHRVSAAPVMGDLEIWHLVNGGNSWSHNVHVHIEEGRILTRDGKTPPEWEKWARKDIYRLGHLDDSGGEVTFAIRFREFGGTYMSHCHNTQHEDHALLQRWDVNNPGQLKAFLTPEPKWNGCTYTDSVTLPTAASGDVEVAQDFFNHNQASDLLCPSGVTADCPGL